MAAEAARAAAAAEAAEAEAEAGPPLDGVLPAERPFEVKGCG